MRKNNDIEIYLKAVEEAVFAMDLNTFGDTVSWHTFDTLIARPWTKRMLKMIDDCERSSLTPKQIGHLFPSISQLRNMMLFDLWMVHFSGFSQKEWEKEFNFFSTVLDGTCLKDPYAAEYSNIIHTKKQINNLLEDIKPASLQIAKRLGIIANVCYHFSHAAYSDMNPSTVYDNYGPYDVSKKFGPNHIMVVKEFNNLRPKELWPETASLPCDNIHAITVYENVKMKVDNISHVMYEGNLIKNLRYYNIFVDGKEYPVQEIDRLLDPIGKLAVKIFQQFQKDNLEKKKEKYYHQKAYVYKQIYDALAQDWRPSEDILAEARGKKPYDVGWPKNGKKQKELFQKIMDPRKK